MNMQQGIMGSHASPDFWISAEKNQDQQNSGAHFVMLSSAENSCSAEIPGKNHWISRSPLHKTRRWVPPNHRSEYKVPPRIFSAEVRYTICVVEFRWKTKKLKSAIFFAIDSGSRDPKFPPKKQICRSNAPLSAATEKMSTKSAEMCLAN